MTENSVVWLEEVGKEDIAIVGGKGASLGEMLRAELPVPTGFAVTAQAFRRFIDETGINDELFGSLEVDVDNADILRNAEKKAKKIMMDAKDATGYRKQHPVKISGNVQERKRGGFCSSSLKRDSRRSSGCKFCRTAGYFP